MPTIDLVQNSTAPQLEFTLTRADGSIVDLTNVTTVDFKIRDQTTGLQTNTAHTQCAVLSQQNAQVVYSLETGDLPSAGSYICDIVMTYTSGRVEINPNYLIIHCRGQVS